MAWSTGEGQPTGYLFRYSDDAGIWTVIDVGTAIDCVSVHGVPTQTALRLRGCRV